MMWFLVPMASCLTLDPSLATHVATLASGPVALVTAGNYVIATEGIREEQEADEVDLYRGTPLRYLGYANEAGEAFRPLIDVVIPSYVVAVSYVLADTLDKTKKALDGPKYISEEATRCAVFEGLDTFLWQIIASVILPGFTIHQIVELSLTLLQDLPQTDFISYLPTLLGFSTIPFIVEPIDQFTYKLLDLTVRRFYTDYLNSCSVEYKG